MKVKCLPLNRFLLSPTGKKTMKSSFVECEPAFLRNGHYLAENKAWLEVDGKAYLSNARQFRYELELYNHKPLSGRQAACIREAVKLGVASKPMRDWLNIEHILRGKLFFKLHVHKIKKMMKKDLQQQDS